MIYNRKSFQVQLYIFKSLYYKNTRFYFINIWCWLYNSTWTLTKFLFFSLTYANNNFNWILFFTKRPSSLLLLFRFWWFYWFSYVSFSYCASNLILIITIKINQLKNEIITYAYCLLYLFLSLIYTWSTYI